MGEEKMIILDFHQVMIANILSHLTSKTINNSEMEENIVRHMILNSLRVIHNKFKDDFGNMVIAYDKSSWRKQVFPYYKHGRRKTQDKSPVDWYKLFDFLGRIKPELKEVLPYKVIEVEGCEADDIIGVLTRYVTRPPLSEDVLIVSGDKDFIQLHNEKVRQYDPVRKKYVSNKLHPKDYLFEHICRGDAGDGIPNVLSDDNTFVDPGKRQTPLTKKRMEEVRYGLSTNTHVSRNFARNEQLIDLTKIPEPLTIQVMSSYADQPVRDRQKLVQYLMQKNCQYLLEHIRDF